MFGVVVTKATMSTSCDILAFAGEAGEMGWWGWGEERILLCQSCLCFCMSWRGAIKLGCFSSFKISKFIHRRSCLYSSPVKTIVVCNKCSKDQ